MTAYFIKCAAGEKRSPTCLNYGQFVEDKTTENKKKNGDTTFLANSANHLK